MNGVLNIRDVDLIARGLFAVHLEVDIRLAESAKDPEILDSLHLPHRVHDLIGLFLENLQIVAVDFRGQFALHAADRFFHVVFNGLGKSPRYAGNFFEFAIHGGNHFIFVLVKCWPPLFLGLQIHEVLGIEKTCGVRAVVGTPNLAGALRHFGK